mgnify:CR=1 FL=1
MKARFSPRTRMTPGVNALRGFAVAALATFAVGLAVAQQTPATPAKPAAAALSSNLPVPLDRTARYAINGKRIDIAIPYPRSATASRVWFFAESENLFLYNAPQSARRTGDWLIVSGEVKKPFAAPIDGLLRFNDAQGLQVRAAPGAISSCTNARAAATIVSREGMVAA